MSLEINNYSYYSYLAPPDEAVRKNRKARRKDGRKRGPKRGYWAHRSAHQRRFDPKRLRFCEVENLILADLHASKIGQRLCSFFTVMWALTADGENNINARWQLLLDGFRKWALRHGFDLHHVWTHENPASGFNSHLLANVPAAHREAAVAWLQKQLGAKERGVHARPRVTAEWHGPDETRDYMLKGTDRGTAMRFHLIKKNGWKSRQGIVLFRRSGCSRSLNRTAREFHEAEFSEQEEAGISQPEAGEYFDQYATRARGVTGITTPMREAASPKPGSFLPITKNAHDGQTA